jgi:hypothetical protein
VGARSTRNTLLAAGAAFGLMSAVLQLISASLSLSDVLAFPSLFTELKVAAAFDIVQWVFGIAAFGTALAAFLIAPRRLRTTVLAVAAVLFVGHGLAQFAGDLLRTIFGASDPGAWQFIAAVSAGSAAGASLAVAAVLVAIGIRSSRPDGRLGAAAIALAVSFALLCAAYGIDLAGYLDLDLPTALPSDLTDGLGTIAAGQFVIAVGALVAGLAFLGSNGRRLRGEAWQAQRERSLGIAATVLAVGFLVASVGRMLVSSAENGSSRNTAEAWLQAVGLLLLAPAAVWGAIGFFVSARAATRAQTV